MSQILNTSYDSDGAYLSRLADVFGDSTRRSIYRHMRSAPDPASASEVADVFGLHRTVARAHLEKLTEVGMLVAGTRRRAGGGRPAKTYALSDERLEVVLPPRRYERLSRNLLRIIDARVPRADQSDAAFSIGREFGEETASLIVGENVKPPVHLAPRAVAAWMDEAGYSVDLTHDDDGTVVLEVRNCVYRELAAEFPDIVCPFDRGTVCGMLGVEPSSHRQTHSLSAGDEFCRHEFRL